MLFHTWAMLLMGSGGVKDRKLLFVLTRSLLQQNPTQSLVRLTALSRAALPGDVKFKRAGEGTGGSLEVCCAGFGGRCFGRKGRTP